MAKPHLRNLQAAFVLMFGKLDWEGTACGIALNQRDVLIDVEHDDVPKVYKLLETFGIDPVGKVKRMGSTYSRFYLPAKDFNLKGYVKFH